MDEIGIRKAMKLITIDKLLNNIENDCTCILCRHEYVKKNEETPCDDCSFSDRFEPAMFIMKAVESIMKADPRFKPVVKNDESYYRQFFVKEIEETDSLKPKKKAEKLKEINDLIHRLATIEPLTGMRISVDWKKNKMYGSNPTATVYVWNGSISENLKGSVSGYGYDKKSSAVAIALNQSSLVLKSVLDHWTDGKEESLSYGLYQYEKGVRPYFKGGVGMDCFVTSFRMMDFEVENMWSESFDGYIVKPVKTLPLADQE